MHVLTAFACYGSWIGSVLQLLSVQMPADDARPLTPLTVCTVLEAANQKKGRMVVVRGVLHQTHRHGTSLREQSGVQSCPGLTGKRKHWTPAVYLLWPSSSAVRVGFSRDLASEMELDRTLKAANVTIKDKIVVTLEGVLEAKPNFQVFRQPDGQFCSTGYGSGGEYPARLVIRRVIETRVAKAGQ